MTTPLLDPPRHRPTWGDLWFVLGATAIIVGALACPDLTGVVTP